MAAPASAQAPVPAAATAAPPTAAPAEPRAFSHRDFDAWRTIANPTLSRDGRWLAYAAQPQQGDGELIWRDNRSGAERRAGVGMLPPPMTTPDAENPDAPPVPRSIRVGFSNDNRWLVASTYPTQVQTVAARKARARPDAQPRGGLLLIDLNSSAPPVTLPRVKSFQLPSKGGAVLAYLKEAEPTVPAAAAVPASAAQAAAAVSAAVQAMRTATGNAGTPPREYGTELVLRDLASGQERRFADVKDYSLSRDGQTLVYTVNSRTESRNGVYVVSTTDATAAPRALLQGKGQYGRPVWDREQTQLAFVSDRDDAAATPAVPVPAFKVYHWARSSAEGAQLRVSTATAGFAAGLAISDKGPLAFSRDGKVLIVPSGKPAKAPKKAEDQPVEEDRVTADLWRWNDDYVQPIQRVRAIQERNRSYPGVLDLASGRFRQIGDETLPLVQFSDDAQRAIGLDDRAYRRLSDFDGRYGDVVVVDPATGARRVALKKQRQGFTGLGRTAWSPDGRWLLQFDAGQWQALDTASGALLPLTRGIKVRFDNEENDVPAPAGAYGTVGWTSDSRSALVYDRYDVWQVFVDGRAPRNLTAGDGRKQKVQYRVQRIEAIDEEDDERGIDTSKPLTLRAESETTRATGFARTTFTATAAPQRLVWGDRAHRFVARAKDADALLFVASRFDTFPELQLSNPDFSQAQVVSNVGAQQKAFRWGRSELMAFKNAKGVPLQAAVYKPQDFDPKKKYPLMVYIYERLSQNVHNFVNPTPSNAINPSLYTSNGYVVLMPDIVYTVGHPGKSALDAVLPAIDTLVKQGGIDEKAIGIAGHSWGGYQIAWMVTQTNRFRAAESGAPVGNMTSAYSGIRWGSGLPRQFQYEQGQSRIGPSLQKALPLYIENSPVFHIEKVKTPVLILHNDADDAVPWYQGIELFLALRRYEKEAYLINYNGQLHNLRRRADQKDFALRMHQFFDHFLKGAPAPSWMSEGIGFNDREDEKERFGKQYLNEVVLPTAPSAAAMPASTPSAPAGSAAGSAAKP